MMLDNISGFEAIVDGRRITKLHQILLNGSNTATLVLGERPEVQMDFLDLC